MGNLHSVAKAVEYVDPHAKVSITGDAATILQADRVIFPGVGAMRDCMAEIRRLGIDEIVARVIESKPLLAICVGMQALMTHSDENNGVDCLDIIPGRVKFFGAHLEDEAGEKLKVPHMGWNCVSQVGAHALWQGVPDNSRFYFVHSYYVEPESDCLKTGNLKKQSSKTGSTSLAPDGEAKTSLDLVTGKTQYGMEFVAAMQKENLFAVQFHPEKSQPAGLILLKNFLGWDGQ